MYQPEIGDDVWYYPSYPRTGAPVAAKVVHVHLDNLVDLVLFWPNGTVGQAVEIAVCDQESPIARGHNCVPKGVIC